LPQQDRHGHRWRQRSPAGLNAAIALQKEAPRGKRIEIVPAETASVNALRAMKLLMAPSAYAAKWWLTFKGVVGPQASDKLPTRAANLVTLMSLPYAYTADWIETQDRSGQKLLLGREALGSRIGADMARDGLTP
jgi:hypothetical protein